MMDVINTGRSFGTLRIEGANDTYTSRSIEQILACLDRSVLLIDDGFRILQANAHALATLGCRSDESSFGRFIVGDGPTQTADMRRKIKEAIFQGGRAMVALQHPRHGRLICSVKGISPFESTVRQALVALTPEHGPAPDVAPYLCDVYRLSKAEAEIAIAASMGAEVPQIMVDRKVSIHTLRAQIASIKAKMGMHRMTEIAAAVARIQAAALI